MDLREGDEGHCAMCGARSKAVNRVVLLLLALVAAPLASLADGLSDLKAAQDAGRRGDDNQAVRLFTAALNQVLSDHERLEAYFGRANAYANEAEYDRAIHDYSDVVRLEPRYSSVYLNRGIAYQKKGNKDLAIADYTEAIRLNPNKTKAYHNRGIVYFEMADYDRALTDYSEAVQLDPNDAVFHASRGHVEYIVAKYLPAADDFAQALAIRPADTYDAIWRYLARQRAGQDGKQELSDWSAASKDSSWPIEVVRYYLGTISRNQILVAAKAGTATPLVNPVCEASVYVGEYDLLRGHADSARSLFEAAVRQCPPDFNEHQLAVAELERQHGK
jgi:lipoprotein NlpI